MSQSAGGPFGKGTLDGDYVVCPWHQWKFHRVEGQGERGFEEDVVPAYHVRVRDGRVEVSPKPHKNGPKPHAPHPLSRTPERQLGRIRVVGISTTAMQKDFPRYSTSDALLEVAMDHAKQAGYDTQMIHLRDLSFRHCEGFYSKAARACTWPCSITQMDPNDQLDRVHEALVHFGDVFLIATPIRWGAPSSLYFKMVERMNCIQNQITISGKALQKKWSARSSPADRTTCRRWRVSCFGFFGELGCQFPQFPYIAHSRGWTAEDMERNIDYVKQSEELRQAARELVDRSANLAERLIANDASAHCHAAVAKVVRCRL